MSKITDREINTKPEGKDKWLNETTIWGHGGLSVRITPKGDRLFYFRYTDSTGKRVRLPIGPYSKASKPGYLTLKEARLRASELASLHETGIKDVKEHLIAQEQTRKAKEEAELARIAREKAALEEEAARIASRKTVADLFEHWASVDLIRHKDGGKEIKRSFNKDVLPRIGQLYIEDVTKSDITEVTDALLSRGVVRLAKLTFSQLRQMFRFAVDRDLIPADPTANIRKVNIGGKDTERDRILSDDEILLLLTQLPIANLRTSTEVAVWIALSTCCRIGELLNAQWKHIDLIKKEWLIPAENSKNGKAHTVYLSAFTASQFATLHSINGDSRWCYPNRSQTGPVCTKTITKQLTDRQREPHSGAMSNRSAAPQALLLPGGKWTPHDLRRTGASMMVAMGVLPEVAERCLNHTEENKVKRIYQRYSYADEMKDAWHRLGDKLSQAAENLHSGPHELSD